MAQGSTVPCRYWVLCGNPTGIVRSFNFEAEAPATLCVPHIEDDHEPDSDGNGVFIVSLVERHNQEILRSRPWRCVTCARQATELLHFTIPLLSPIADQTDLEQFVPTVVDVCAPICISGGECDRAAYKMVHEYSKSIFDVQKLESTKTCDTCGKKSGVKVCGGCKYIAYCSKECQSKGWPTHKRQCKHAQKEARRTEIDSG